MSSSHLILRLSCFLFVSRDLGLPMLSNVTVWIFICRISIVRIAVNIRQYYTTTLILLLISVFVANFSIIERGILRAADLTSVF
jgi:hypothetical protein